MRIVVLAITCPPLYVYLHHLWTCAGHMPLQGQVSGSLRSDRSVSRTIFISAAVPRAGCSITIPCTVPSLLIPTSSWTAYSLIQVPCPGAWANTGCESNVDRAAPVNGAATAHTAATGNFMVLLTPVSTLERQTKQQLDSVLVFRGRWFDGCHGQVTACPCRLSDEHKQTSLPMPPSATHRLRCVAALLMTPHRVASDAHRYAYESRD